MENDGRICRSCVYFCRLENGDCFKRGRGAVSKNDGRCPACEDYFAIE